jgi:type II secretory pathway pseudopilin PulG
MCIPLAALSIIGSLAGAAASAAGSIYQGQAQAASYKAQAKSAEMQAQAERDAGSYASARQDERNQRLTGQQVTAVARSGVDLYGSPTSVIADARTEGELDKMAIRRNAQFKSNLLQYEAKVAKMNAKTSKTAGYIGAIAPVLTGVTGAFDTYSKNQA